MMNKHFEINLHVQVKTTLSWLHSFRLKVIEILNAHTHTPIAGGIHLFGAFVMCFSACSEIHNKQRYAERKISLGPIYFVDQS